MRWLQAVHVLDIQLAFTEPRNCGEGSRELTTDCAFILRRHEYHALSAKSTIGESVLKYCNTLSQQHTNDHPSAICVTKQDSYFPITSIPKQSTI